MSDIDAYTEGQECCVRWCLDDILVYITSIRIINKVKSFLSSQFNKKDLGQADVIIKASELKKIKVFRLPNVTIPGSSLGSLVKVGLLPDPSSELEENTGKSINC